MLVSSRDVERHDMPMMVSKVLMDGHEPFKTFTTSTNKVTQYQDLLGLSRLLLMAS